MKKLIFAFLLLSLLFLSGCSDYKSKYENLQEEYDDLLAKYDSINSWYYDDKEDIGFELDRITDSIGSLEDDIATVWCYFENEEGTTFDEAYASFDKISSVLTSIIYPSH